MAHKRKAVDSGSSRKQPRRSRHKSSPADVAKLSDVGRPGRAMESTNSKPKRNPRRVAKDRWEEEKLMTSDKSQLIDLDLVKLLAQPEAWTCLEEAEKKEILNLLPCDVHPNPDPPPNDPEATIPPLPESFLRYSNNWRDGVRQFQVDLQNGHYDPKWLRDAEEAMKQRAVGEFDRFKDREFEEFWGQKQRFDRTLAAGQSSQIKLSTLIQHGLVRKGDVWRFSRGFSKGAQKILIEKEAKIVEINGSSLTFAIPPGERVFLNTHRKSYRPNLTSPSKMLADGHGPEETNTKEDVHMNNTVINTSPKKRNPEPIPVLKKKGRGRPRKVQSEVSIPQLEKTLNVAVEVSSQLVAEKTSTLPVTENNTGSVSNPQNNIEVVLGMTTNDTSSQLAPPGDSYEGPEDIIIPDIQGPTALCNKIVEVDGRIKDIPHGNAWKEIRSYRDNQDMGSLWEIRQAWFLRGT